MLDRVPTKPGRVKLTRDDGTVEYAVMERADEPIQEGTPLNKATLLSDATAALLGGCSTPDGALAFLGRFNQHWWRRRSVTPSYIEKQTTAEPNFYDSDLYLTITAHEDKGGTEFPISFSDKVIIDQETGMVSLGPFETIQISYVNFPDKKPTLKGKYITGVHNATGNIYYLPTNVDMPRRDDGLSTYFVTQARISDGVMVISSQIYTDYGPWQFLQSSDRNAYPDSGIVDGYEYEYLGVPFDNAVTAPELATGSYTGTGTCGENNPNNLMFPFKPKIVLIGTGLDGQNANMSHGIMVNGWNLGIVWSTSSDGNIFITPTFNGHSVSWYRNSNSPIDQFNYSEQRYSYLAIG